MEHLAAPVQKLRHGKDTVGSAVVENQTDLIKHRLYHTAVHHVFVFPWVKDNIGEMQLPCLVDVIAPLHQISAPQWFQ